MGKVLFIVVLIEAVAIYFLWGERETLKENVVKLELALQQQKEAIETIQQQYEVQGQALQDMTVKNAEINGEMNRYLSIFSRHDLTKLAAAKPGLIEPRVNKGTKDVFETIEQDTNELYEISKSGTDSSDTE